MSGVTSSMKNKVGHRDGDSWGGARRGSRGFEQRPEGGEGGSRRRAETRRHRQGQRECRDPGKKVFESVQGTGRRPIWLEPSEQGQECELIREEVIKKTV